MCIEEAQRRRHSGWVRGYLRDRAEYGAYNVPLDARLEGS